MGTSVHPDLVWQVILDTSRWSGWVPGVRAVRATTQHLGPTTRGRVRLGPGLWVPLRVRRFIHLESLTVQVGLARVHLELRGTPDGGARVEVAGLPLGLGRRFGRALQDAVSGAPR